MKHTNRISSAQGVSVLRSMSKKIANNDYYNTHRELLHWYSLWLFPGCSDQSRYRDQCPDNWDDLIVWVSSVVWTFSSTSLVLSLVSVTEIGSGFPLDRAGQLKVVSLSEWLRIWWVLGEGHLWGIWGSIEESRLKVWFHIEQKCFAWHMHRWSMSNCHNIYWLQSLYLRVISITRDVLLFYRPNLGIPHVCLWQILNEVDLNDQIAYHGEPNLVLHNPWWSIWYGLRTEQWYSWVQNKIFTYMNW